MMNKYMIVICVRGLYDICTWTTRVRGLYDICTWTTRVRGLYDMCVRDYIIYVCTVICVR